MTESVNLKGIDYLEFTTSNLNGDIYNLFLKLGFNLELLGDDQVLFSQGQVRFLLTASINGDSQARQYFNNHGDGVCKMAFRVEDAEKSLEILLKRGAKLVEKLTVEETPEGPIKRASIQGFGDVLNEIVSRPNKVFNTQLNVSHFKENNPLNVRCSRIDHLTNNVPHGEMEKWVQFYKDIYGFKETRYFDIKGTKTGLFSKVVQNESGTVIIPINEPNSPDGKGQIQEFLDQHAGAGVQHIALMTPDIVETISDLQNRNLEFLNVPKTYYQDLPKRKIKPIDEDINKLEKHQILVDGDEEGYLLQIFSKTYIGPLFFEYIQRKNHWGFGEGNFQALFDAIERDQIERGVL